MPPPPDFFIISALLDPCRSSPELQQADSNIDLQQPPFQPPSALDSSPLKPGHKNYSISCCEGPRGIVSLKPRRGIFYPSSLGLSFPYRSRRVAMNGALGSLAGAKPELLKRQDDHYPSCKGSVATAGLQAGDIWVSAAPQSPPRHESLLPEPLITYLAPFDSKDHKQLKNGKPTVRGAVIRDRE